MCVKIIFKHIENTCAVVLKTSVFIIEMLF